MATYSDDFNRADSASVVGTGWTTRSGVAMGISTNALQVATGWGFATYDTPMSTDDALVSGVIVTAQPSDYVLVGLGCPSSGNNVLFIAWSGDLTHGIYTATDWALGGITERSAAGTYTFGPRVDDVLSIRRIGSVYTAFVNRVRTKSWNDTGVLQPINSSNRLTIAGGLNGGVARKLDSWSAADVTAAGVSPLGITVEAAGSAVITASRSPSVAFGATYVPRENDVVVFFTSSAAISATPTAQSGWVNPLTASVDVESDAHEVAACYHLVTAAEASAVTTTYTHTNWYGATVTGNVIGCVLRGVDPASVIGSTNTALNIGNVTAHTLPGLASPASTGSLVLSCVCSDGVTAYSALPAGWTWVSTLATNTAKAVLARNTLTTASSTIVDTTITGASDEFAAITLEFKAAPTAGPVTGTLAATLQKALMATAGGQSQLGDIAATLQKATAILTGAQAQSGTSAATLQRATFAGSGAQAQSGTAAPALQRATAALTGVMQPQGGIAAATTLAAFAGVGEQAAPAVTGTMAAAIPAATAALTGAQTQQGALTAATQRVTSALTGAQTQQGVAAATLQRTTAALTGVMQPAGTVAASLQRATANLQGAQTQQGVIAASLQRGTTSLTGVMQPKGTIAATTQLALYTGAGTAAQPPGTFSANLTTAVVTAVGAMAPRGTITAAMQQALFAGLAGQEQRGAAAAAITALTMAAAGAMQPQGTLAATGAAALFTGQGEQIQAGIMAAGVQAITATMYGWLPIEGALASLLNPMDFEAQGSGGVIAGQIAAALHELLFTATGLRPTQPSEERTTIVAAMSRLTQVQAADRSTLVGAASRTTTVERRL